MVAQIETAQEVAIAENVLTLEWHKLRFHIVTREPLTDDEVKLIKRVLPKMESVGLIAETLGMILGRGVRIRTERPSPDIRLEVGL
jgi:hypothetical protein